MGLPSSWASQAGRSERGFTPPPGGCIRQPVRAGCQAVAVRQTRAGWQNGIRVVLTHRPWEASTRSSGVNEPQINVDHFYHRPIYHVVGLLGEQSEISAISRDLASAGVDVAAVEILCGEQGARILDEHGRYHGLRARIVRVFSGSATTRRPWRSTTRR